MGIDGLPSPKSFQGEPITQSRIIFMLSWLDSNVNEIVINLNRASESMADCSTTRSHTAAKAISEIISSKLENTTNRLEETMAETNDKIDIMIDMLQAWMTNTSTMRSLSSATMSPSSGVDRENQRGLQFGNPYPGPTFISNDYVDARIVELNQLQEIDGIDDYHQRFVLISSSMSLLSDEYLVNVYLGGLRYDKQMHLRMFHPQTIRDCLSLCRLYERAHSKQTCENTEVVDCEEEENLEEDSVVVIEENELFYEPVLVSQLQDTNVTQQEDLIHDRKSIMDIDSAHELKLHTSTSCETVDDVDEKESVEEKESIDPVLVSQLQDTKVSQKQELIYYAMDTHGPLETTDSKIVTNCVTQSQVPVSTLELTRRCLEESLVIVDDLSSGIGVMDGYVLDVVQVNCPHQEEFVKSLQSKLDISMRRKISTSRYSWINRNEIDENCITHLHRSTRVWEPGGVVNDRYTWNLTRELDMLDVWCFVGVKTFIELYSCEYKLWEWFLCYQGFEEKGIHISSGETNIFAGSEMRHVEAYLVELSKIAIIWFSWKKLESFLWFVYELKMKMNLFGKIWWFVYKESNRTLPAQGLSPSVVQTEFSLSLQVENVFWSQAHSQVRTYARPLLHFHHAHVSQKIYYSVWHRRRMKFKLCLTRRVDLLQRTNRRPFQNLTMNSRSHMDFVGSRSQIYTSGARKLRKNWWFKYKRSTIVL